MHEDTPHGWPPARPGVVTVDLDREGIAVTSQDGDRRRVSIVDHRESVVRRLLDEGLSPRILRVLMPEFGTLIDELTEA